MSAISDLKYGITQVGCIERRLFTAYMNSQISKNRDAAQYYRDGVSTIREHLKAMKLALKALKQEHNGHV